MQAVQNDQPGQYIYREYGNIEPAVTGCLQENLQQAHDGAVPWAQPDVLTAHHLRKIINASPEILGESIFKRFYRNPFKSCIT